MHPQIPNPIKSWRDYSPHHQSLPLQQMWEKWKMIRWTLLPLCCKADSAADCPTQSLQVVHLIQFLVTGHRRNIAKYIGLENTTFEHCSWRVQSNSDLVARPPPPPPFKLPRKKKFEVCKHQPYVKRCILNVQRCKTHPSMIAVTTRTKQ